MADPVIVPPVPTVKVGEQIPAAPPESPPDITVKSMEAMLDKSHPMRPEQKTPEPPVTEQVPAKPITTAEPPQQPASQPEAKVEERKMPSFLEEALKPEPSQAPQTTTAEDWPEEFPDVKASDETKTNWKKFRAEYKALKDQLKQRPSSAPTDEAVQARMQTLEAQNKEMQTTMSRMGVEQNVEFQQNVMRPLHNAWNEATRIVKESGKDPGDLARALTLQGKNQFEALDELFDGMPESAKAEVHDAIRSYRHFDVIRQNAIKNAPQTFEQLRRREMDRQLQELNHQKQEMVTLFDEAVTTLRDNAKVEILRHTDDPDTAWWNEQADSIVSSAKNLYLENTDMKKMALACVLAPMADKYRQLWMSERAARTKAETTLKEKFGAEPSLSQSSGNAGASLQPPEQLKADLNRPFKDVFLDEFHRQRAKSGG